jgi:hypothetical protein
MRFQYVFAKLDQLYECSCFSKDSVTFQNFLYCFRRLNMLAIFELLPYIEDLTFLGENFPKYMSYIVPQVKKYIDTNGAPFEESKQNVVGSEKLKFFNLLVEDRLKEVRESERKKQLLGMLLYNDLNLKEIFLEKIKVRL